MEKILPICRAFNGQGSIADRGRRTSRLDRGGRQPARLQAADRVDGGVGEDEERRQLTPWWAKTLRFVTGKDAPKFVVHETLRQVEAARLRVNAILQSDNPTIEMHELRNFQWIEDFLKFAADYFKQVDAIAYGPYAKKKEYAIAY